MIKIQTETPTLKNLMFSFRLNFTNWFKWRQQNYSYQDKLREISVQNKLSYSGRF